MKKEIIVHKDPKSPISEIFRTLRTNIQFMNTNKKMRVLLVTSTLPGEGKSWTASNLAVTFAQAGKKVIMVDADMRKGRQYAIFGVSPRPGLSNFLSGIGIDEDDEVDSLDLADYIQETEVENLYLMSAGNIPPNPSELLVSAQMVRLLDELKQICDIVIVDGTPCELVADSIILSRLVDSTLIVTAHKSTKKDALNRVIKNIQNVGGKLAGVVINKMPITSKKYNQRYYYGSTTIQQPVKNRNKTQRVPIRTNSRQQKVEQLKRRVRPEEPRKVKMEDSPKRRSEETERPKALKNNIKVEKSSQISLEKTQDILKQINQYLDQEKKNLK